MGSGKRRRDRAAGYGLATPLMRMIIINIFEYYKGNSPFPVDEALGVNDTLMFGSHPKGALISERCLPFEMLGKNPKPAIRAGKKLTGPFHC
jgi:hypothetical protein